VRFQQFGNIYAVPAVDCEDCRCLCHAEGRVEFERGAPAAVFAVSDSKGKLHLDLNTSETSLAFADIDVRVTNAPLKPLYDALLSLFHGQIVQRIYEEMDHALKGPAPAAVNRLLAQVPSEVRFVRALVPGSCTNVAVVFGGLAAHRGALEGALCCEQRMSAVLDTPACLTSLLLCYSCNLRAARLVQRTRAGIAHKTTIEAHVSYARSCL
jgi:hypothetical protein